MTEIKKLEQEIRNHNRLYWEDQNPQISDQAYDVLTNKLKELDPDNLILTKIHTLAITNKKVTHRIPMLSLAKVYTIEELFKWCNKVARNQDEEFLIQIKFDGVSANYENGILATRGDGYIGEDISDKLPIINIVENSENIRGEILFTKENFENYKSICKKKDGSEYSNPRNACAGILNRDDNPFTMPVLDLVPFNYVSKIVTLSKIQKIDFNELIRRAQNFSMPADGLVIKLADEEYKNSLGITSHHPKGEMALKFANEIAITTLLDVVWNCGKEVITPVGNVTPIKIGGVVIKKVSLHNMKFIKDNDIHIGDKLTIERAGDVIPHVIAVQCGDYKINIKITNCPECGMQIEYKEPNIKCPNPNCVGGNLNRFYDSIVRIGIERIGKPTLKNMMQILDTNNLIDLFSVTKNDLLKLPKFGEKKAQNTLNEIEKVKDAGVYEWQILATINIPGIGRTLSKILCDKFGISKLIDLCHKSNCISKLSAVEGIEEKRACDIQKGIKTNLDYIKALSKLLPLKVYASVKDTPLQTICFSGKFDEKKSFYYKKLEGKYVIMEKVNKNLDILVVADPSQNSTKQQKAEKLGIKIMNVNEIIQ